MLLISLFFYFSELSLNRLVLLKVDVYARNLILSLHMFVASEVFYKQRDDFDLHDLQAMKRRLDPI